MSEADASATPELERPTELTDAIADEICERIADGESLRKICEDLHMPKRSRVFRWLEAPANHAFADQYARAREASGDADADDVGFIAGEVAAGRIDPHAGRVAMDGKKWSAGKRKPKKYGEKVALVGGGPGDDPIRVAADLSALTDQELDILERIHAKIAGPGRDQGGEGAAEG